jgi:hypothetical protein
MIPMSKKCTTVICLLSRNISLTDPCTLSFRFERIGNFSVLHALSAASGLFDCTYFFLTGEILKK